MEQAQVRLVDRNDRIGPRREAGRNARLVQRALAGEAAHPDEIAARTGLSPAEVAVAVEELAELELAEISRGFVWPR